ncbi:MAG: phosphoribosylformylglycinamidine synthase subunit PurQ, partial [Marinibacterium sp.]
MRAAVVVFPGSNCDRDLAVALAAAGADVDMVWHKETDLPAGVDLVALPGGFSYGDYLRCGAIAAQSPVVRAVKAHADRGGYALGICNGFQVLTEAGMLPGALLRNTNQHYICRSVGLEVVTSDSTFTAGYDAGQHLTVPIAHHDGNYFADDATLQDLRSSDRIAFR